MQAAEGVAILSNEAQRSGSVLRRPVRQTFPGVCSIPTSWGVFHLI